MACAGYATQYKLYKNVHTKMYTMYKPEGPFRTNPIIFKMFAKSETMLLVTLLQISFKLYTLYNLLVPLGSGTSSGLCR